MKRWGVFLFCLTLLFPQRSHALGYSHEPIYLGDPFMEAFVPEVRTLRALVILDGFKLDPAWREYATVQHYLVLRLNTDSYASDLPEKGKAAANQALKHALIRAQKLLVDRTGHGEIPNLPIVAMGFSRFSGIGQKIEAIFPGRLLCFLTGFGPKGTKALAKDDLHARVPSQYLGNGWEDIYSESKKTTLSGDGRLERFAW